jgi:hypothetical protein
MREIEQGRALTGDLDCHPAVQAWARNTSLSERPTQVEVLKESRKTAVYRMEGVGPDGAVIAKRCEAPAAKLETILYREVFPRLSATTPVFYGSEEIPGGEYWWVFLEDGGNEAKTSWRGCEKTLAVQWLAALHTSSYLLDLEFLPDAGPASYLDLHLREGRKQILDNLGNPAFSHAERDFLRKIVADMEAVACRWDEVERFSSGMPKTLVHGDFVSKNIRIKDRAGEKVLLVFDWETAGHGVPAADLALCPDTRAYLRLVNQTWPQTSEEDIRRLVLQGRLFRVLASICWQSYSLASKWAVLEMKTMGYFQAELTELMRVFGWSAGRRRSA